MSLNFKRNTSFRRYEAALSGNKTLITDRRYYPDGCVYALELVRRHPHLGMETVFGGLYLHLESGEIEPEGFDLTRYLEDIRLSTGLSDKFRYMLIAMCEPPDLI